jgi:hypothetical protein
MAAAASFTASKKKDSLPRDGLPNDVLTGMGLQTQRHFLHVRQNMIEYVDSQEESDYDGKILKPHTHHHRHHHHNVDFNNLFVDGIKQSKSLEQNKSPRIHSKSLTPSSTRKHSSDHETSSPSHRTGSSSSHHGTSSPNHRTSSSHSHHGTSSSRHGTKPSSTTSSK